LKDKRHCLFGARQPNIDFDVSRWDTKRVSVEGGAVEIRAPRGNRVFNNSLPEKTYKPGQRLLVDLQYDFVSADTSEFEIEVHLVKLPEELNIATANSIDLDKALSETFGRSVKGDKSPSPAEQTVHMRKWIYYDNSADVTYGQSRESYGTLLDSRTVLLITGWYGPNLRKNPKWFASRRKLLNDVRDTANILRSSIDAEFP
jgi:hypothetical protein